MATQSLFCAWPNGLVLRLDTSITVDDEGAGITDQPGDESSRKITFPIQTVTLVPGGNQVDTAFWSAWKTANPGSSLIGTAILGS